MNMIGDKIARSGEYKKWLIKDFKQRVSIKVLLDMPTNGSKIIDEIEIGHP
jgi:hypothetical protein